MEQLSGLNGLFLQAEQPGFPLTLSAAAIYDPSTAPEGFVRFKDILQAFENGIPQTSLFRRRLVEVPLNLDHAYWVEAPDFDLEYHVRHIALPQPGDWRQLYIQLARLQSRPLDKAHPLWEAYVIEGLNNLDGVPEGSFCIMLRMHYAVLESTSALDVFTTLHDLSPAKPQAYPNRLNQNPTETMPNRVRLLRNAVGNQLKRGQATVETLTESLSTYRRVKRDTAKGLFQEPEQPVSTRFNGQVSRYRSISKFSLSLDKVQQIQQQADNASFNDIILTIIGGGLRKYLAAHNELPGISLVGGLPTSRKRSRDDRSPNFNLLNVALGTNIKDPKQRLRQVMQANQQSKTYNNAISSNLVRDLSQNTPPIITSLLLKALTGPMANSAIGTVNNTLISNVANVSLPVYLAGAELTDILALGPLLPNMGLFHGVSTVCDKVTITATGCRTMLPDPAFYTKCMQDSFDELTKAMLPKPKRVRRAKAKAS